MYGNRTKDPIKAFKSLIAIFARVISAGQNLCPAHKSIGTYQGGSGFQKRIHSFGTDGAFSSPPPAFLKLLAEVRKNPGVEIYAFVIGSTPGAADFCDKVVLLNGVGERDKLVQIMTPVL